MSRFIYQANWVDQSGNIVGEGIVSVFLAGTETPANVYPTSVGGSSVNSVISSTLGLFKFYVDEGEYSNSQKFKIILSKTGYQPRSFDDLVILTLLPSDPVFNTVTAGISANGIVVAAGSISRSHINGSIVFATGSALNNTHNFTTAGVERFQVGDFGITTNFGHYAVGATKNSAGFISYVIGDANWRHYVDADGSHFWGDGINTQDTNLYRADANLLATSDGFAALYVTTSRDLAALTTFQCNVIGDSNIRYAVSADGTIQFGSGASAVDTNLYRLSANRLKTDGVFECSELLTIQNSNSNAFSTYLSGDTVNRFTIDLQGLVQWGAGGASAVDTNLYRSAANFLKTDDGFGALYFSSSQVGSGSTSYQAFVSGDPFVRFAISAAGAMSWGSGAVGVDTNLYRGGIDTLQTDSVFVSENFKRGSGSPEGVYTGVVGDTYARTDGGTDTTIYRKESGSGNTGWVAATAGGGGIVLQRVWSEDATTNQGTTQIPVDSSHPSNTEGDQKLSRTITPASTSNYLIIEVILNASPDTTNWVSVALYRDAIVNALVTTSKYLNSGSLNQFILRHRMLAPSTGIHTFKVRVGPSVAGTVTWNGAYGIGKFGTSYISSISITEETP